MTAMERAVSAMEATFSEMENEWRSDRTHTHAPGCALWEEQFDNLQREKWRLVEEGLWIHGRSDLLGVLGLERDELTHSRMIAWLLDPCARHGLGIRVLGGILELFQRPSDASLEQVRITREVSLLDSRLDIVVKAPRFHLVIENKIDAQEGAEQCATYSKHLPDALCILLSPDGRQSNTESTFRPLRYAQLAAILRRALSETTNAESGRRVAEDYLLTLETEFA